VRGERVELEMLVGVVERRHGRKTLATGGSGSSQGRGAPISGKPRKEPRP
jgi:hypothetical protein